MSFAWDGWMDGWDGLMEADRQTCGQVEESGR